VGAIGGALAGWVGVDFLCYLTPSEHLCLPTADDVREGVIVSRIAAHAADLARGRQQSWERDLAMSRARRDLDWEKQFSLVIDPVKAREYREKNPPSHEEYCTMCGEMCAIGLIRKYLREDRGKGE
jgi:phosphomethylpyrimidine synthase